MLEDTTPTMHWIHQQLFIFTHTILSSVQAANAVSSKKGSRLTHKNLQAIETSAIGLILPQMFRKNLFILLFGKKLFIKPARWLSTYWRYLSKPGRQPEFDPQDAPTSRKRGPTSLKSRKHGSHVIVSKANTLHSQKQRGGTSLRQKLRR